MVAESGDGAREKELTEATMSRMPAGRSAVAAGGRIGDILRVHPASGQVEGEGTAVFLCLRGIGQAASSRREGLREREGSAFGLRIGRGRMKTW